MAAIWIFRERSPWIGWRRWTGGVRSRKSGVEGSLRVTGMGAENKRLEQKTAWLASNSLWPHIWQPLQQCSLTCLRFIMYLGLLLVLQCSLSWCSWWSSVTPLSLTSDETNCNIHWFTNPLHCIRCTLSVLQRKNLGLLLVLKIISYIFS